VLSAQRADLLADQQVDRSKAPGSGDTGSGTLPSRFVVQFYDAAGAFLQERRLPVHETEPGPRVPADPQWLTAHDKRPVTVPATSGGGSWRAVVRTLPGGKKVVVATDLSEVDGTVRLLTTIEVVAGAAVALALAAVGVATARSEAASAARARSEERMRRFVADAGHELRTPLTVIRSFADYYRQRQRREAGRRGEVATDLDRMVGHVDRVAIRMSGLVDGLLLLARLDAQRPLQRSPVDVLELAADAVRDARLVAPERRIGFTFGDDVAFIVEGDDARLRQAIGNLVSNALTHTPAGTPIDIRVAAMGKDVVVEVSDEGPGLGAEQAERVFERFYRAEPSRGAAAGSGLGLSIVDAVVTAHQGTVSVDTVPGRGATFRVTLPLAL
jgi:two-component system OmpR family sensor kinase